SKSEPLGAFTAGRVAGAIAEVLHVVHVQPQQMADAVREQQRDDAIRRELDRVAAQDAEVDEPGRERLTGEHVNVAVTAAGRDGGDRLLLRGEDDLVELALRRRVTPRRGPRAGDVARPSG